jgi:hypothetical protein
MFEKFNIFEKHIISAKIKYYSKFVIFIFVF